VPVSPWAPAEPPNVEVCGAASQVVDEAMRSLPRPATPPC
jgi:hypothetical protein